MSIYFVISRLLEICCKVARIECIKTHSMYTRSIQDSSIVIDLGANVGDFSVAMVNQFGCECHAIEPVTAVFNSIPSIDGINKYNLAIASIPGPVLIHTSVNRECHSIHKSIADEYGLLSSVEVPGIPFDRLIQDLGISQVDVLKVDIEGAEAMLFQSLDEILLSRIGQITIEFHDFVPGSITKQQVASICQRLKKSGFLMLPFSWMFPQMATCDMLFINMQKLDCPFGDRMFFSAIRILLYLQYTKCRIAGKN